MQLQVRTRMVMSACVIVAVTLAFGGSLLVRGHRLSLIAGLTTNAELRADDIASTLTKGTLPSELTVPREDEGLIQILDQFRSVIAASGNIEGEPALFDTTAPEIGFIHFTAKSVPIGDNSFRIVARRVSSTTGNFTIYVGYSLESVDQSVNSITALLLIGLPLLVLVVGLVTWLTTTRALKPIETMRRDVESMTADRLYKRVTVPAPNDEVRRLALTMNDLIDRIEQAQRLQNQFVENASHELRSPLASLRVQLEVSRPNASEIEISLTREHLLSETVRLQLLVDDLLDAAQISRSRNMPMGIVDLDDVIFDVVQRIRVTTLHPINLSNVSAGQVRADRRQIERLVTNLVDNAVRHCASVVSIGLVETDSHVVLTVSDDGAGIPQVDRQRIFDRFERIDDGRGRPEGGFGLGLAMVASIARVHDATVAVTDNNPGAKFVVTFPRP
ncbi:MAG: HAMP domain-containing sensor histidine kinase [Ilumatobacteraceae bacterium]